MIPAKGSILPFNRKLNKTFSRRNIFIQASYVRQLVGRSVSRLFGRMVYLKKRRLELQAWRFEHSPPPQQKRVIPD